MKRLAVVYYLAYLSALRKLTTMTDKNIAYVSDESFEREVVSADRVTLVCFTAEWCGPCRALGPVLNQIANEHMESVKVVKVDIDESPKTPTKLDIRSVPTMIVFRNGTEVARTVGLVPKSRILALL